MSVPLMFFNSPVPKFLNKSWDAVTLPPAIYFSQKAKDVDTELFMHEFAHYEFWLELCTKTLPGTNINLGYFYLLIFAGSYAIMGYDGSRLEKQAREHSKLKPSLVEQAWIDLVRKLNK